MEKKKPKIIVLLGPTASGKTELSLKISDYLDVEIISADSRQIYKYLDIGTAKPSPEELKKVEHHFISIINPDEYYSAGMFAKVANETIKKIYQKGKIPLVVGGSGLYIKALCEGLFESDYENEQKKEIRDILLRMKDELGNEHIYEILKSYDPEAAAMYPDKNPSRIIRALEYIYITGKKFSSSIKRISPPFFETIYIGLMSDRVNYYSRINQRTEIMWNAGLLTETKKILEKGFSPDLNSLNTVGYKECISLIRAEIDEKTAIEKIKQHTRNYAKRQMTWFRKIPNVHWINTDDKLLNNVLTFIKDSF